MEELEPATAIFYDQARLPVQLGHQPSHKTWDPHKSLLERSAGAGGRARGEEGRWEQRGGREAVVGVYCIREE